MFEALSSLGPGQHAPEDAVPEMTIPLRPCAEGVLSSLEGSYPEFDVEGLIDRSEVH